jgi:tight adherence protein C
MSIIGPWGTAAAVIVVAGALRPGLLYARRPARPSPAVASDPTHSEASAGNERWWRHHGFVTGRHSRRAIEQVWPDAVELVVHALEAGLTPRQAMTHLVAHGPEPTRHGFAAVIHRTERGQPFADALRALPDALGAPAAGIADVIGTSDRYGLPLAPVLDRLARDARDARRRLDQIATRKLPVRLSFPLVTCTLPSFVLLAIAPPVVAALSSLGASAW